VNRVEIIKVEVEIVKSKLLAFLAIASGSWFYAFKLEGKVFTIALFFGFIIASYGIFANIFKLSDLQKELKGLSNG